MNDKVIQLQILLIILLRYNVNRDSIQKRRLQFFNFQNIKFLSFLYKLLNFFFQYCTCKWQKHKLCW